MHRFTTSGMAGLTVALALMPAFASADTVLDLQNQIQTLLSQLKTLQTQLWQVKSSSTATTTPSMGNAFGKHCIELKRDLKEGHRGDDVKEVQKFLREHSESGFTGSDTGFFGAMTKKAMKKFAEHNGVAMANGTLPREVFMRDCVEGMKDGMGMQKKNDARGTVASVTGSTFMITLPGTTTPRLVTSNASTTIRVFATATTTTYTVGTLADVTVGKVVKVVGIGQVDKSLLATEISVYPMGTVVMMENHDGMMKSMKKMFDNKGRHSNDEDDN